MVSYSHHILTHLQITTISYSRLPWAYDDGDGVPCDGGGDGDDVHCAGDR